MQIEGVSTNCIRADQRLIDNLRQHSRHKKHQAVRKSRGFGRVFSICTIGIIVTLAWPAHTMPQNTAPQVLFTPTTSSLGSKGSNWHDRPQAIAAAYVGGELLATTAVDDESVAPANATADTNVVGWLEHVWLLDPHIKLKAVLHTGVIISAINAPDFQAFTRDGLIWVRFSMKNTEGANFNVEHPVVRFYQLRTERVPDKKRPVIRMKLCLAGKKIEGHFIIWNRATEGYNIILGRSILAKRAIVDPSGKFLGDGKCSSIE